ncbi:MAG TPA: pyridoxamine 5'-phosphate oxidase [Alphaproteobacteria bacterium]
MLIRARDDPVALFNEWLSEAVAKEPNDPNAVCLATVGAGGVPSARMVLLKGADAAGFVFFTNLGSRKGAEIKANPRAALCFHWKSLRRQVRVEGPASRVTDDAADAYFASRTRQSRIGAWASKQSQPLASRYELERRVAKYAARFGLGEVPRPPFWSGFRIVPLRIEFWRSGNFRLHDRLVYERDDAGDAGWRTARLFP